MSEEVENKGISDMKESYWQDVHQKKIDLDELKSEFPENAEYNYLETGKSRRNFLKVMGISLTTLPLASCFKVPVRKALPYLKKDELSVPGVAWWFATTCQGCEATCPLLVKNREGRPIKVEGNDLYTPTGGGCCALGQGSLLGLYDSSRFKTPLKEGKQVSWENADKDLVARLKQTAAAKKDIVIVSGELKSPSTMALIDDFSQQFESVKHVVYSPVSKSALVEAHEMVFGVSSAPQYNLKEANVVLSVGSNFLVTGNAPVQMTRQYAERKDLSKKAVPFKHIQVESIMTLTGSNADQRILLPAGESGRFLLALLKELQSKAGVTYFAQTAPVTSMDTTQIKNVAAQLWSAKSRSVVIAGSNDLRTQVATALINAVLGSYNTTLLLENSPHHKYANDTEVEKLVASMEKGAVGAVIFWDVNPAYDYHQVNRFNSALKQVPVRIAAVLAPNETSTQCNFVLPTNHFFESWGDFYQGQGHLSVSQPLMAPLRGSRMFQETLLSWMKKDVDFLGYIKRYWEKNFFRQQSSQTVFIDFWEQSLQDGLAKTDYSMKPVQVGNSSNFGSVLSVTAKSGSEPRLLLYEKGHVRDGRWASNPWYQELPDPITKVTWDNYLMMSPKLARKQGLTSGDVVRITAKETSIEVPVLVQPGTEENSLGLALGYGKKVTGGDGKAVGVNAFPLTGFDGRNRSCLADVQISGAGKKVEFALTQTHHSMEGRDIVRETTLGQYVKNPKSGNENKVKLVNFWSTHKKEGFQWAMA
ncbi:MAG: hypothetical protein HQ517_01420, partial [SAR324 cluster bacterium]|nr:hypothetical protein [SAR324 cluster bacterium]